MRFWAVVPAAGIGRRMGCATPKQYLDLAGVPIIARTLQRLSEVDYIQDCVVALSADDEFFGDIPKPPALNIIIASGGQERADSVLNSLEVIKEHGGQPDDWVLVHDAVRPLVRVKDIEKMITDLCETVDGGILAGGVHDTVKQVASDNSITATLDRTIIWRAFTPQMFRLGILQNALEQARRKKLLITDESQAVEQLGYKPKIIPADVGNIKITNQRDLQYAAWLLTADS